MIVFFEEKNNFSKFQKSLTFWKQRSIKKKIFENKCPGQLHHRCIGNPRRYRDGRLRSHYCRCTHISPSNESWSFSLLLYIVSRLLSTVEIRLRYSKSIIKKSKPDRASTSETSGEPNVFHVPITGCPLVIFSFKKFVLTLDKTSIH